MLSVLLSVWPAYDNEKAQNFGLPALHSPTAGESNGARRRQTEREHSRLRTSGNLRRAAESLRGKPKRSLPIFIVTSPASASCFQPCANTSMRGWKHEALAGDVTIKI